MSPPLSLPPPSLKRHSPPWYPILPHELDISIGMRAYNVTVPPPLPPPVLASGGPPRPPMPPPTAPDQSTPSGEESGGGPASVMAPGFRPPFHPILPNAQSQQQPARPPMPPIPPTRPPLADGGLLLGGPAGMHAALGPTGMGPMGMPFPFPPLDGMHGGALGPPPMGPNGLPFAPMGPMGPFGPMGGQMGMPPGMGMPPRLGFPPGGPLGSTKRVMLHRMGAFGGRSRCGAVEGNRMCSRSPSSPIASFRQTAWLREMSPCVRLPLLRFTGWRYRLIPSLLGPSSSSLPLPHMAHRNGVAAPAAPATSLHALRGLRTSPEPVPAPGQWRGWSWADGRGCLPQGWACVCV